MKSVRDIENGKFIEIKPNWDKMLQIYNVQGFFESKKLLCGKISHLCEFEFASGSKGNIYWKHLNLN